jgi:hypothetical protein
MWAGYGGRMKRRIAGYAFVGVICLLTTGCFSIEQEVFLNADGSGDFIVHVAMPDFPQELLASMKGAGPENPAGEIDKITKELSTNIPPTITLKEVKQVRQNGALGFYIVYHFKDLSEMGAVLANFGKDSFKGNELSAKPEWSVNLKKSGGRSVYTGTFLMDMSDSLKKQEKTKAPPSGAKDPGAKDKKADSLDQFGAEFEKLGEQMAMMLMGTFKFRFVLHAPSPITDTNADIVLNKTTAVWSCSPAAFVKQKKPIVMRAGF